MSKLIVFSAPSGSGKTSILREILEKSPDLNLSFSISTTSRLPRGAEQNGTDYYFISKEEFQQKIQQQAFLEWQEVYADNFYGTYKTEIDRLSNLGKNILFDIDVFGAINIKKQFGEEALLLFIQPPSIQELQNRLEKRNTESAEKIQMRIQKAQQEMEQVPFFDEVIVNDDFSVAVEQTEKIIRNFLEK